MIVTSGLCGRCDHPAVHTDEPWDNQFRCASGCRCTMQGCCVTKTITLDDAISTRHLNGAPA